MSLGEIYDALGKAHCGMRDGTLGKAHCGLRELRIPERCYKTERDGRWMSSLS